MQRRARSSSEESWLLSYADLITNLLLFFVVLLSAASLSKGKMQQITKAMSGQQSAASLESIQKEIDREIAAKELQAMVSSQLTDEGLEISFNSGLVFDSGQARVRAEAEPTLAALMLVLEPYSTKYGFAVEGHTDSQPLNKGAVFLTNWELASARAITVRERLEKQGIPRERIRVEGYADTKPLPEEQLTGLTPEARAARHRRVVVRIY